jgi:hypothetical protein
VRKSSTRNPESVQVPHKVTGRNDPLETVRECATVYVRYLILSCKATEAPLLRRPRLQHHPSPVERTGEPTQDGVKAPTPRTNPRRTDTTTDGSLILPPHPTAALLSSVFPPTPSRQQHCTPHTPRSLRSHADCLLIKAGFATHANATASQVIPPHAHPRTRTQWIFVWIGSLSAGRISRSRTT